MPGSEPSRRPIMLVAGEASGDLHGATLARGLRDLAPGRLLFGMGGGRMAAAGVELVEDVTAAAVVGGTEAVNRLPRLWRAYRHLVRVLETRPPGALVLIDFPEFNLRLARAARRAGIPVVYFVPPQLWAWRPARIATMRRQVSLVLAVFPFETPLYRRAAVPVEFVGHPVLDALAGAPSREHARRVLGVDGRRAVVGLLPGSRREEVARMLPVLRDAATRIAAIHPETVFVLGLAPTIPRDTLGDLGSGRSRITVHPDGAYDVMRASDVLMVASDTATLEAAVLGTPMVVGYRVSPLTEAMVRLLVRVPWISLTNLVLGRAAVPELYQRLATGPDLARETLRLLEDDAARHAQRQAFLELAQMLGAPGVGTRAARCVLSACA